MKKLLEKTDFLAGILAIIAVIAIICEVAFGGFTKESIVGGIKDITGIVVDVLVLIVAASVFIRKPLNFKDKFKEAMNSITDKYSPLLVEDKEEKTIRYNIANNSDALFSGEANGAERIFQLDKNNPEEICFYINKSFFDRQGGNDFDAQLIANQITVRLTAVYKNYDIRPFKNKNNYAIRVKFNKTMNSKEDIDMLIDLIDYTILLFVARNKS